MVMIAKAARRILCLCITFTSCRGAEVPRVRLYPTAGQIKPVCIPTCTGRRIIRHLPVGVVLESEGEVEQLLVSSVEQDSPQFLGQHRCPAPVVRVPAVTVPTSVV